MSSCGSSRRLCWFNKRPNLLSCCFLSFLLPVPLFPTGCAFVTFSTRAMAQNAIKAMHQSQTMEVLYHLPSLRFLCANGGEWKAILSCVDCSHDNHRCKLSPPFSSFIHTPPPLISLPPPHFLLPPARSPL